MSDRAGDDGLQIRVVRAGEVYPVRHRVLRAHQTIDQVGFKEDEEEDTRHFGAFADLAPDLCQKLVGVVTMIRGTKNGEGDPGAWRLRGMATVPEVRGRGFGKKLVAACMEYVRSRGGSYIWCDARMNAVGFYEALGFKVCSEVFEIKEIGPHFVMRREL